MNKANSRKSANKKRQARKAQSYSVGQARKDARRGKNQPLPGTMQPAGPIQKKRSVLYHQKWLDAKSITFVKSFE